MTQQALLDRCDKHKLLTEKVEFPISLPKVWDLIDKFKEHCKPKGWNAYQNEDLIEAENEYHKFVWVNHLYPNTFKRVVLDKLWNLCAVREGVSYRKLSLSYLAWVLPETPSRSIWRAFDDSPSLSTRVSLYDLSEAYAGNMACSKINETESVVLQEFERFLRSEYGIKFSPPSKLRASSK